MSQKKIVIVKYGSSSVSGSQGIDQGRLERYAAGLALLYRGRDFVVVSSGAVSVGRSIWHAGHGGSGDKEASLRALAMLGSGQAFTAWQAALMQHGILAGQLLVTHREVDDLAEGISLRSAIAENLDRGIITVVNENDALSDIELAKLSYGGDNDGLAAHLAIRLKACGLLLMTDVDGLSVGGRVQRQVGRTENARSAALRSAGAAGLYGRGGMFSKVTAALQAARSGIDAYIAHAGSDPSAVLAGKCGTRFVADDFTE